MQRHQSSGRLSIGERIKVIEYKYRFTSPIIITRTWKREMQSVPPTRATINLVFNKFLTTGSVADLHKTGRPVSKSDEIKEDIEGRLNDAPNTSLRRMSLELDASYSTVRKVVRECKFKPYIPRLRQELSEDDFDRRVEFCELFQEMMEDQPDLPELIIWSDEAKFHVNGSVNRHNSVYWCKENPGISIGKSVNSPGVMVWGAVHANGLVGPFFFDEQVTGNSYLAMLNDYFLPRFQNLEQNNHMFFMQDGAPAHFSRVVREFLDEHFAGRWFGRRGAIDWPPRSPDMTPMDFCVWGCIKNAVYKTPINSVDDLKEKITNAFVAFDNEVCKNACLSVPLRLQKCIDNEGKHFES